MPTYEYQCIECGIKYETHQSMTEAAAPLCCTKTMRQIYRASGLAFKGTGWGHQ